MPSKIQAFPAVALERLKAMRDSKIYKNIFRSFIAAILVIDVLSISYFRILDRFELITLDFRYGLRLTPNKRVNPDIAIIEIGEDTLKTLGKWPLPRDYHASLIDVLSRLGARAVIFDILFCEPTGWDSLLVESAKKAGNCYFPFAFRIDNTGRGRIIEAQTIDDPLLTDLQAAAKGTGHINKLTDADGKTRRIPLFIKYRGRPYPSIAFKAACDYLGMRRTPIPHKHGLYVKLKDNYVPLEEDGTFLLNFAGRWADTFKHYSYLDILAAYNEYAHGKKPRINLSSLKGKVCFVGLTATGTQELGPVPTESSYPMLGIHANLFNDLTQNIYLKRCGRSWNLALFIILAVLLLFLVRRLKPFLAFFAFIAVCLMFLISCSLVFAFYGLWIDMAYPTVMLFGIYLTITINKYISEIKGREKIQKELAVAASIQNCFLPDGIPEVEGLDVAVRMKTAKEVGGDLYDFVNLSAGRLGIMIGDVSGKGVPASLFMAKVETLFKVFSKSERSPSKVLSRLNNEIALDERSGLFTTLIYAIVDVKSSSLQFSDAGHLPIIVIRDGGHECLTSDDGMALGVMEGATFADKTVRLKKGDTVIFYTDGIPEARNIKGEEFGIERLVDILKGINHLSAEEMLGAVTDQVRRFQGKAFQHDDITLILVKFS